MDLYKYLLTLLLTLFLSSIFFAQKLKENNIVSQRNYPPFIKERLDEGKVSHNIHSIQNRLHSKLLKSSVISVVDSVLGMGYDSIKFRNIYTYDTMGNLITDVEEKYIEGKWEASIVNQYLYDDNNKKIQYTNHDERFAYDLRYKYEYDTSGNIISVDVEELINDVWEDYSSFTYVYNSENKMESALKKRWRNSKWTDDYMYTVTYSTEGNDEIVIRLYSYWKDNEWQIRYRDTESYNEFDKLAYYLYEMLDESDWVPYESGFNSFDSNNNVISSFYEVWWDNVLENCWHAAYNYDSFSKLISANCGILKDSIWIPDANHLEFFNENNQGYYFTASEIEVFWAEITGVNEETSSIAGYNLAQNYPNPFNPTTTISYYLPKRGLVQLNIYDMLGREVAILVNREQTAGTHNVDFEAANLASGIYLYRLQQDQYVTIKKMILIK